MEFHLVGNRAHRQPVNGIFHHGDGVVGHTDMRRVAAIMGFLQLFQRGGIVAMLIGPVKKKHIDLIQPQIAKRLFNRWQKVIGSEIFRADLGGDQKLVTGQAKGREAVSHLALIFVHLCRIKTPIPDLCREAHGRGQFVAA